MSYRKAFGWNHDFPRLVRQLGFKFITDRPKLLIDWNLIGCVDIDNIVFNSEVVILEKHINDVIYYSLQGEEIKILDPKFVKLFRLAQLTIEYLIFCLHYLDKGFIQLQDNLSDLKKENEGLLEELFEKEKTVQKCKKKIGELQNALKPSSYISSEELFECKVCKKQFINEIFLNAHQARRQHNTIKNNQPLENTKESSTPQDSHKCDTQKLFTEIKELKERLNNTEHILKTDKSVYDSSKIDKDVQVELIINNEIHNDNYVQCNLIDDDKGNQLDTIRMELRQWKDDEANKILNQLEKIKEKFNINMEKTPDAVINNGRSDNELYNFEILEEKFEKKLESNIERLKHELATQEPLWLHKPPNLEIKTDLSANKFPQNTFSIQHNAPIIIEHETTDSSSVQIKKIKPESKSVQTFETITKDQATSVTPLTTTNKATATNCLTENQSVATISLKKYRNSENGVQPIIQNEFTSVENKIALPDRKNTDTSDDSISKIDAVEKLDNNKPDELISKTSLLNLGTRSITSLKIAGNDANFLNEFKTIIEDIMYHSLQELGVDPQWKSIPQDTFESHFRSLQHTQKFLTKTHPNYYEFKNDIVNAVEKKMLEQSMKENILNIEKKVPPNHSVKSSSLCSIPLKSRTIEKNSSKLFQTNDAASHNLSLKTSTLPIKTSPRPTNEWTRAEDINSIKTFHRTKSLHIINRKSNRQKRKFVEKSCEQLPKSQLELQQYNPEPRKHLDNSQSVLSSILKVKDKVLSVFKTSNLQKTFKKVNQNESPKTLPPNTTEGVYKLTVLDEKNNLIQPAKSIISITPVEKHSRIFNKSKSSFQSHTNNQYMSSSSEFEEKDKDLRTLKVNNHNLEKNLDNSNDSDMISSAKFTTKVITDSSTIKTKKIDPFLIKTNEYTTKSLPSTELTKQSEVNLGNVIDTEVMNPVSMYGNNSDSSEQSFLPQKLPSTSTPKRLSITEFESNLKVENQPRESIFLKPNTSVASAKKKVIFDLKSKNSIEDPSYEKSKPAPDSNIDYSKNKLMAVQTSEFALNSKNLSILKPFIDDGDTTSISSSVLDGSTKNSKGESRMVKENQNVYNEKNSLNDDLVLSDFDVSSD